MSASDCSHGLAPRLNRSKKLTVCIATTSNVALDEEQTHELLGGPPARELLARQPAARGGPLHRDVAPSEHRIDELVEGFLRHAFAPVVVGQVVAVAAASMTMLPFLRVSSRLGGEVAA